MYKTFDKKEKKNVNKKKLFNNIECRNKIR